MFVELPFQYVSQILKFLVRAASWPLKSSDSIGIPCTLWQYDRQLDLVERTMDLSASSHEPLVKRCAPTHEDIAPCS